MPTTNQLIRQGRKRQTKKSLTPIMDGCPQNAGREISHHPRHAGHGGRRKAQAGKIQVRRKDPEIIGAFHPYFNYRRI